MRSEGLDSGTFKVDEGVLGATTVVSRPTSMRQSGGFEIIVAVIVVSIIIIVAVIIVSIVPVVVAIGVFLQDPVLVTQLWLAYGLDALLAGGSDGDQAGQKDQGELED